MDRTLLRKPLYTVVFLGLLLFYLTAYGYLYQPNVGADANGCRSVYMYPSFARIRSFDESHTKFAAKFSLYLYREQGKDTIPADEKAGFESLDGIPALFIPGNAGSYRQMRSIAAEVSNLYFDGIFTDNPNARNYDFFGADFNEDFSAFHGRTLLDQAEFVNDAIRFILLLYTNKERPPTSVMILGHSMGGIVARVLPTLPNYVPGSINTIVTLSSPHLAAPLTFDGDIAKVYLAIDRFWYDAFNPDPDTLGLAYTRLHNISLVSITGGLLDTILPADYTTLGFLVPPSNGFAVYTTGIPDVWTPMDHLAIVWCRQLRRVVLAMLLDIADVTSPHRTYPLEQRMTIMRRHLLSGFENYAKRDVLPPSRASHMTLRFDERDLDRAPLNYHMWKSYKPSKLITSFMLSNSSVLVLMDEPLPYIDVLLCRKLGSSDATWDLTGKSTTKHVELNCANLQEFAHHIPRSQKSLTLMDSAMDGSVHPFAALRLDSADYEGYEQVVVVDRRGSDEENEKEKREANEGEEGETNEGEREHKTEQDGFIIVEVYQDRIQHNLGTNLFSLMTRGAAVSLLSDSPLVVDMHVPGAWSSILAYRLRINGVESDIVQPFVRQWKEEPYETKWHLDVVAHNNVLVSMHGIAPFTPFNQRPDTRGLNLELWKMPQTGKNDIHVVLTVDWLSSLKLLVMRYRLAIVSQCLAVTALVTMIQFANYVDSGKFPDYVYGLQRVTLPSIMLPILVILCLLTPLTKLRSIQTMLNVVDPVVLRDPNEMNLSLHKDFTLNSFFLGLQENALSGVSWLFFAMAVGLNWLVYHVLVLVGSVFVMAGSLVLPLLPKNIASGVGLKRRRFVVTALIMGAVVFFLPYQFAYMVSFALQTITTIKVMAKQSKSVWNYHMSFLMMMLWVLPINIPVFIVFVHNLNITRGTPFSSHHNFLAVAPIVAVTEMHSFLLERLPLNFGMENGQQMSKNVFLKVTFAILGYTVFYCIIYGVRHTFWLHHLFNFWCGWLLVAYMDLTYIQNEKTK